MALVKTETEYEIEEIDLNSPMECLEYFHTEEDVEKKHYALDKLKEFDGSELVLLSILIDGELDPKFTNYVASILGKSTLNQSVVDGLFSLLEFENAHIRNLAIEILQEQGDNLSEFFEPYLDSYDRDTRIFLANILGNTKLKKSREYLLRLISEEEDINVCMTCVDYLGEIGEPEDVETLKELKERFKDDFYAGFAVDKAIKAIEG